MGTEWNGSLLTLLTPVTRIARPARELCACRGDCVCSTVDSDYSDTKGVILNSVDEGVGVTY
jgi:hypothetical protein